MVFFDTTSIYFHGEGGESIGQKGYSKDHRGDLNQMIVGVVIDGQGRPICCEIWPGNTADINTLIPITDRGKSRYGISNICMVADRGMISRQTIMQLKERNISYILGTRAKRVVEIRDHVLSTAGRYREVYPEKTSSSDHSPLKVKEVTYRNTRYIICLSAAQAGKDARDHSGMNPFGSCLCSFLALILKNELNMRLEKLGFDLTSLREITLDEDGNRILLRTECRGGCHDVSKRKVWPYHRRSDEAKRMSKIICSANKYFRSCNRLSLKYFTFSTVKLQLTFVLYTILGRWYEKQCPYLGY